MTEHQGAPIPSIPLEAQEEILDKLFTDYRISSDEIVRILKKYEVAGDVNALQDSYRRRIGQRLMASLRDNAGKREVLSGKKREYVILECCNDQNQLKTIRSRIQSQMGGLDVSIGKVNERIQVMDRFTPKRARAGKGTSTKRNRRE